jgi:signal transduction histidine kinase/CheY-like chemotaxis protein
LGTIHDFTCVRRPTLWVGFVLAVGVGLSWLAFDAAQRRRASENERRAIEITHSRVEKLRVSILRSMEVLHSLAALHGVDGELDRRRFRAFVGPALERQPELQALSWNPLVPLEQRSAFEASARRSGMDGYAIHGQGTTNGLGVPVPSEAHVPVGWIEPYERNATVAGFDLNSDAARRRSLELARDSGMPVATAPIRLAQAQNDPAGFLVMLPVYIGGRTPVTVVERRQQLAGFYVAVFRMTDLVTGTLRELAALGIDARLSDESPAGGAISGGNRREGEMRLPFEVATRQWSLAFSLTPEFESTYSRFAPLLILLAGLLCAFLTTGYLHRGWRRTLEVDAANRALLREIEERERAEHAAEAANRAKSEFLANMSHEIRTPLNAILGYSQILQRDARIELEQRDAVAGIGTSGHHLLGLLNEILDFSKIEAGRMELRMAPFHLGALARGLAVTFRPLCLRKQLGFRLDLEATVAGWVLGDESKLRQVLINLCGNAVKFTEMGEVALRIEKRPTGRWLFSVADTGPGIAGEDLCRIFEPFHQGERGQQPGGTGLGLAIAKKQVELLGGELLVESTMGIGSRFHFEIPMEASVGAETEQTAIRRLEPGSRIRVLVVDDYEPSRQAFVGVLKSVGCDVSQAADGVSAIRAAHGERPDLVLLDLLMPGLSMVETVRGLRSVLGEGLKIIAHTASNASACRGAAMEAGCNAFLWKPFRFEELFGLMQDLLGVRFEEQPSTPAFMTEAEPLPSLEGVRVEVPEALAARLSVAAELHSATALKSVLTELRCLGPGASLLAEHIRSRMRAYDMSGIQRILSETVAPETRRNPSAELHTHALHD